MPNSFRPLKGNCPICSGARRDCRENTHASLIHCRHDVGTVPGFRFVGTDAHGFNMWAVDDGTRRDDADWETQRQQKAAERERRLRSDAFHFAALLSVEERDHNIRKIHGQLGLTTRHRQNLRSRRLSDAEIDAGNFFSIDPWCSVLGINPQLAGVDLYGKHLTIGQPGFACPIWDEKRRIIGWQTRFDDAKSNKYRWPTSRSLKRPNGPTAHLQNGELPLTCCRPVSGVKLKSIGLAEGFLKPYVAAQKLGQIVIGAAGGNLAGSPQQLKAYLDALSLELATTTVDLYPDAGALTNKTVMGHYERTIKLLQSWGYTVRVAWWGQYTLDQPDIDELENFDTTAYLTTESFLENSFSECHQTVYCDGAPTECGPNTILWARFIDGYNPNGCSNWITAIDPLLTESERHFHNVSSLHIHKVTGAIKSLQGSDPKAVYERMKEIAEAGIYRELTQLTHKPWKEINKAKLDLDKCGLEPGAIYVIRSAKGTHKTNSLVPITPKFSNVYAWFNRIALGREECHRIGLEWKDDLKGFRGSLKVGFCADSSFSFPPGLLKNNGLLLVDEADQVFEHMFGDTCNKEGKRPLVLGVLKAQLDTVIAGDGIGIFMSADITDKEFEYISQLAPPGCPVRLIVNHYQPPKSDVYFFDSKTPDGLIENLLQDLENGKPRFVIDDIKNGVRGCKSIAEYIRKVHPEWAEDIVEINSDTSGSPAIIDYIKNINTMSQTTLLLCCSPSVVSGISIENGHFKEVYAFLNGVLTISQALQSVSRPRGAEVINIWAAEKGVIFARDRSLFPEQIKGYYNRNYSANSKHLLAFDVNYNPLKDEWDSPHFDLY